VAGIRQLIKIYLWAINDPPAPSEEKVLSCARDYLINAGMEEIAESLARYPTITRDGKGKPYFPGVPGLHFSLSHSGQYSACAFFHAPVGLDLQIHTRCDREAIARRFFHPDEYAYLKSKDFEPFFRVWAAKESYVKYTGAGIAGTLRKFAVADISGMKSGVGEAVLCHSTPWEGYSMCLCAKLFDREYNLSLSYLPIGYCHI
jgi:phosphopantetheinyl transferase